MPDEQALKGAQGGLGESIEILISTGIAVFLAVVLVVFYIYRSCKNKNTQNPKEVSSLADPYPKKVNSSADPFSFIEAATEGKNQKTIKSLLDGLSKLSSPYNLGYFEKNRIWRDILNCACKLEGINSEDVNFNFEEKVHNEKNVVTVLDWMVKDIHKLDSHSSCDTVIIQSINRYIINLNNIRMEAFLYLGEDHEFSYLDEDHKFLYLDEDHKLELPATVFLNGFPAQLNIKNSAN